MSNYHVIIIYKDFIELIFVTFLLLDSNIVNAEEANMTLITL